MKNPASSGNAYGQRMSPSVPMESGHGVTKGSVHGAPMKSGRLATIIAFEEKPSKRAAEREG